MQCILFDTLTEFDYFIKYFINMLIFVLTSIYYRGKMIMNNFSMPYFYHFVKMMTKNES